MNESETRAELIDPALQAAGWGVVERSRIRREYTITLGRTHGHGIYAIHALQNARNLFDSHLVALAAETQRLTPIYEQKLAALVALKKSLLHQAFSGQL
ncbi:MAG: hypothetical protein ACK449_12655 [Planctomycetota bacterium]|jgi:hypothetical protein